MGSVALPGVNVCVLLLMFPRFLTLSFLAIVTSAGFMFLLQGIVRSVISFSLRLPTDRALPLNNHVLVKNPTCWWHEEQMLKATLTTQLIELEKPSVSSLTHSRG